MSSLVVLPDPTVPALIDPDQDPPPQLPQFPTEPQKLNPPSTWIARPVLAACQHLHIATQGQDGKPDLSALRPRVLLALILPDGGKLVILMHPHQAQGWASSLASAALGAMTLPAAPRPQTEPPTSPTRDAA